jgi:hypothetical protein
VWNPPNKKYELILEIEKRKKREERDRERKGGA